MSKQYECTTRRQDLRFAKKSTITILNVRKDNLQRSFLAVIVLSFQFFQSESKKTFTNMCLT